MQVRVGVDRGVEGLEVGVAQLLGHGEHLSLDAGHLLQAERMDGVGTEIGNGGDLHLISIEGPTVEQNRETFLRPTLRNIFSPDEDSEANVDRTHLHLHHVDDDNLEAGLLRLKKDDGELSKGLEKGINLDQRGQKLVTLVGDLEKKENKKHEPIPHTIPHLLDHIIENLQHLTETDCVILIILHHIEKHHNHKLKQVNVNATVLKQQHLPLPETHTLQTNTQLAHHKIQIQPLLIHKPNKIKNLEALQEVNVLLKIHLNNKLS